LPSVSKNKKVDVESEQKVLSEFIENGKPENKYTFRVKRRKNNKKNKGITGIPHPFLKWAGGKRQLIKQFDRYFPPHYKKYIEPFVGGGSVFFYLLPDNAILMDINEELVNCYRVIQTQVDDLIQLLKAHRNEKEYFYKIRNVDRNSEDFSKWSNIQRASRTIFLNRCCFNGLFRVNSKGEFNVPFGKYKNPKFCDEENLRTVHRVLQNVQIISSNFKKCLEFAEREDFIYFDPPYQPVSGTANFTSYSKEGFGEAAQVALFEVFKELDSRGCKVMLSNSYTKFILDLYKEFRIITMKAKRAINSDATKRGEIKEALVLNY